MKRDKEKEENIKMSCKEKKKWSVINSYSYAEKEKTSRMLMMVLLLIGRRGPVYWAGSCNLCMYGTKKKEEEEEGRPKPTNQPNRG